MKRSYRADFKLTLSELFVEHLKKTPSLNSASLSTRRFAAWAYFSRLLDEVILTITREIMPVHAKPADITAVRWSQGITPRNYATHETYSSFFSYVYNISQLTSELTKEDNMKGEKQGFPRHEVSDKQEVLFEDVSPSTAFSIRQQSPSYYQNASEL